MQRRDRKPRKNTRNAPGFLFAQAPPSKRTGQPPFVRDAMALLGRKEDALCKCGKPHDNWPDDPAVPGDRPLCQMCWEAASGGSWWGEVTGRTPEISRDEILAFWEEGGIKERQDGECQEVLDGLIAHYLSLPIEEQGRLLRDADQLHRRQKEPCDVISRREAREIMNTFWREML